MARHIQELRNKQAVFYVYLLRSIPFPKRFYTGYSTDVQGRLLEHNEGKSVYTKSFKPWKLEFYCAFSKKSLAIEFERYLKSASGIAFRNKRLLDRKIS